MIEKIVTATAEHPKIALAAIGSLVLVNVGITTATVVNSINESKKIEEVNKKLDELLKAIDDLEDDESEEDKDD